MDFENLRALDGFEKLTKENYVDWKVQIRLLLKLQGLGHTIGLPYNGHQVAPSVQNQRDAMLLITGLLPIHMLKIVKNADTAQEMLDAIDNEINYHYFPL